ncbi:F-box/LRR-repeat protein At3g59190-like [Syzygium oleosum]|uniref:F-box/LRR-repeat protein At3g59190-like n=1 Tax=Syzygium oleosum TaxID=219896 RepID=UPI0011D2230E|nr:F-box/LRR-repeat protein At3g59190-like [Syzygium oleosum]XP_056172051.1 F-box/LRR-repeat protein At3g59190-like [Syzygium oleosum]
MDKRPAVKKARRHDSKNNDSSCNRLGDLPDALLQHILGFLPLKDVVRTSALSRRWESLWASVPNLYFNELEFPDRLCFLGFVERALLLRDSSPLKSFSLLCFVDREASRINSWICTAMRCKVQNLRVCLWLPSEPDINFVFPSCTFRSETLTEFYLDMHNYARLPPSICLPKLKILTLVGVTFEDDGSIEKLFSVPSLQKLTLLDCIWSHLKALNISAPKLGSLYITEKVVSTDIINNCPVLINAPNLLYFYYTGGFFSKYAIYGASVLVQALVGVHGPVEGISDQFGSHGYKLLKDLSSVKHLTVTYNILEVFNVRKDFLDSFPVFSCLLVLAFNLDRVKLDSKALLAMLSNSSCLISISFGGGLVVDSEKDEGILDPAPQCFMSSLKFITICKFDATDDQLLAVSIMLRAAKVLDRICIKCSEHWSENFSGNLLQHIMELPRSSDQCTISLVT